MIIIAIVILGAALILTRVPATPDRAERPAPTPTVTRLPPTATALPLATPPESIVASPTPTPTPVPKPDIGVQGQFVGPDGDLGINIALVGGGNLFPGVNRLLEFSLIKQ